MLQIATKFKNPYFSGALESGLFFGFRLYSEITLRARIFLESENRTRSHGRKMYVSRALPLCYAAGFSR